MNELTVQKVSEAVEAMYEAWGRQAGLWTAWRLDQDLLDLAPDYREMEWWQNALV